MKKTLLSWLIAVASPAAIADFQASFALNQSQYDVEYDNGYSESKREHTHKNFNVNFYLSPVSTSDVPILEAGFLSKSTTFSVENERVKVKFIPNRFYRSYPSGYGGYGSDFEFDNYQSFGGQTVVSDWIIGAELTQFDYFDIYSITGGYYILDGAAVEVTLGQYRLHEKYDYEDGSDPEDKIPRQIAYHQVIDLAGNSALSFSLAYLNSGLGEYEHLVDFSYFFTPAISLKADYYKSHPHNRNYDSETAYGLTGNYFFSEVFGIELGYTKEDDGDDEYSIIDFGIKINL